MTLVASFVVAGQARHQLLRVTALDLGEELGGAAATQDRGPATVVGDHHRVAADLILKAMRCGHRPSLVWCAILLSGAALAVGCGGEQIATTATEGAPGVKGERPGREAASGLNLSASDCAVLAARLEHDLGIAIEHWSEPTPPLSRCQLIGPGTGANIYLDAAYAARQRYKNRIVEQAQFGAPDPDKLPHPVAGVGDGGSRGGTAEWVPSLLSLFAVRGNRWLTVAFAVPGQPDAFNRAEAATLARLGFRVSSTG